MRLVDITDLAVSGVVIAFACLVLFVLIPAGIDDPGSIDVMALGPAFWPSVVCAFLGAMGLIVGVQALRRMRAARSGTVSGQGDSGGPDAAEAAEIEAAGFSPTRWLGALGLLAAYYAGLDRLGMVLTSMLALGLFMILGGERRPVVMVLLSVILPLALYVFFRFVANVFIPLGVFEGWLG